MSVAAAALALRRPFELEGRKLMLRPLNYEDLAHFSLWLEEKAKASLFRSIEAGEGDAKALHGSLLEQVVAGKFEPGSPTFNDATRSQAGSRKILELMLVPPDGEKSPDEWREKTSWEVFAEPDVFDRALATMAEVNSPPLAVRLRRCPAPPEIPSR